MRLNYRPLTTRAPSTLLLRVRFKSPRQWQVVVLNRFCVPDSSDLFSHALGLALGVALHRREYVHFHPMIGTDFVRLGRTEPPGPTVPRIGSPFLGGFVWNVARMLNGLKVDRVEQAPYYQGRTATIFTLRPPHPWSLTGVHSVALLCLLADAETLRPLEGKALDEQGRVVAVTHFEFGEGSPDGQVSDLTLWTSVKPGQIELSQQVMQRGWRIHKGVREETPPHLETVAVTVPISERLIVREFRREAGILLPASVEVYGAKHLLLHAVFRDYLVNVGLPAEELVIPLLPHVREGDNSPRRLRPQPPNRPNSSPFWTGR